MFVLKGAVSPDCTDLNRCVVAIGLWRNEHVRRVFNDPSALVNSRWILDIALCGDCASYFIILNEKSRMVIWSALPSYFGLTSQGTGQ